MPNKAFSTIANRVEALIPQAPRPTVLEHLRIAARIACEKSLAWRYVPAKVTLSPGVYEYAFDVPLMSEVEAIFSASINGQRIDLLNLDAAIDRYPDWADLFSGESADTVWSETPSSNIGSDQLNEQQVNGGNEFVVPDAIVADASRPAAITMVSPQRFIILPLPDAEEDYELRLWLALKPRRDATEMDEQAFDELEDVIVNGALESLFAMPAKTWTNPDYAVYYGNKYREGFYEKKRRANLGHVRGSLGVRAVPWL